MRLPKLRFRLTVRRLLALIALTALGLAGWRFARDEPGTQWIAFKLRHGTHAMRRTALEEVVAMWAADKQSAVALVRRRAPAGISPDRWRRSRVRRMELVTPAVLDAAHYPDPAERPRVVKAIETYLIQWRYFQEPLLDLNERDTAARMLTVLMDTLRDTDSRCRAAALDAFPTIGWPRFRWSSTAAPITASGSTPASSRRCKSWPSPRPIATECRSRS